MNADLARKRARQQNSRTHPLRLDPSWETNPESTTLLWTCLTCECLSLPPPWLERSDEKCAVGKPTDHTEKTRARPLLVRQGLRACVCLCLAVPLPPGKRQRHRHRQRLNRSQVNTSKNGPQARGWAIRLSRQIARCREQKQKLNLYSPVEAPRRGRGLGRQPVVPKQVVSVARVCKFLDCKSRASCESGCDRFR